MISQETAHRHQFDGARRPRTTMWMVSLVDFFMSEPGFTGLVDLQDKSLKYQVPFNECVLSFEARFAEV